MLAVCWYCLTALVLQAPSAGAAQARQTIEPELLHLRSGAEREWSEFPKTPHGQRLETTFAASKNDSEQTLLVRQQDVKQVWAVSLNDQKLGQLVQDENDMVKAFAIPTGCLVDGQNKLKIESPPAGNAPSDDIRVGQLVLVASSLQELVHEATLEVEVIDAQSSKPLPCRLTVLNADGALQTVGAASHEHLAVRPGIVFTATGQASFGLSAGRYTIYAGRGFEYSLAQTELSIKAGETLKTKLKIQREVPTEGYVASDTHVHTLTHSGHGDATLEERTVTLAGEGIELPIATDHNKYIDYEEAATSLGVRRYFTPVVGDEVTTPRGHFNIFPVAAGASLVDYRQSDWGVLFDEIWRTPSVKVAILNHARDLHSGVRPFGPQHYNALVGENLDGWPMRFNAMETINSGATQSDPLQLFRDWIGLLNRGLEVTPVGCSDSHDVGRHFVGQGRTYVRCDDRQPDKIDIDAAMNSFVSGQVMVSYGLLTEIKVNDQYRSGELATGQGIAGDQFRVDVRVLGPHWCHASQVELWANGQPLVVAAIPQPPAANLPVGVKWSGGWTFTKPAHDVHLVAVATGPGIDGLYWKTAKPYQPTSPEWRAMTIGCSGAVWLDADGDGRRTSAREYAQRALVDAGQDYRKLVEVLSKYDEAVAEQAAYLLHNGGVSLEAQSLIEALERATPATDAGFQAFREARRENEIARARP